MDHEPSAYSEKWYSVFAEGVPPEVTDREIAFVVRHLPQPSYRNVLDLACGLGRHAIPLARMGYDVFGVDTNAWAITQAQRGAPPRATFRVLDMRRLDDLVQSFDGAMSLWQSFGYFDDETNARVLRSLVRLVRPGGRLIVDLYNSEAMRVLPPFETVDRGGTVVEVQRRWFGSRLRVELGYQNHAPPDAFEWRVYTTDEWEQLATSAGLEVVTRCAWYDERLAPSASHSRMQYVMEKRVGTPESSSPRHGTLWPRRPSLPLP